MKKLVKTVCVRFGIQKAIVSIAVVDDEHIINLNKKFLKNRKNTDVLSFNLSDTQNDGDKCFEIIVNAEMALRCAKKENHSPQTELALYVTHGLLHQFGFNDNNPENIEKMRNAEEQILQQLGYDFVYN